MKVKSKVKHSARGVDPRIVRLADKIGLPIFRRDKELWLDGDVQLTYQYIDQKSHRKPATDEDRINMACRILRTILQSRKEQGTPKERLAAVMKGLRETVPQYQVNTYTYYREPSLDQGWMICCRFSPEWEMGLELCGLFDMGPRPSAKHTIERADNDGNYEPGNCSWQPLKVQARNKRNTRFITIGGQRKSLAEWAELSGIGEFTIRKRLDLGWNPDRLLLPVRKKEKSCKA